MLSTKTLSPHDSYKGLAMGAWFALAWTWRGSDTPFILGLLLVCIWAWITHIKGQKHPQLPNGVKSSLILWCAIILITTLWRFLTDASFDFANLSASFKWLALGLFVPCGWLLFRQQSRLLWLLLTPALVVIVRIIDHTSLSTWEADLFGRGFNGFGLHHVRFGMLASLALISVVALGPALVRSLTRYRWVAIVVLLMAGLLLAQTLFRSGSRSGIIGLCIGIAVLIWQYRRFLAQKLLTTHGAVASVLVVGLLSGVIFANAEQLHKRFFVGAFQQANYSLNVDDIPRDKDIFLGRRLHLSVFGVEKWQDKPLFGYGPGNAKTLLKADPDFHIHPHLHNMYVQTLVEIGLVGALAWLSITIALLLGVLKYGKQMNQPHILHYFWSIAIALAIWSIQSAPIYNAAWRFAVLLICSLATMICYLGRSNTDQQS